VHNASQWYWNVSSYCGPEFDYYTLYADTFKINGDLGIIYPGNLVPSIGPHDVLLEGIDSNDMDAKCIRKFRINVTNGDNSKLPFVPLNNDSSIRFGTAFYTYRGFNFYQLILATGTNNAKPLYFMVLPPALENMSCGGFLTLDVYTGELSGIVTAPPGNYTIEIGVVQLLSNVSMPYVAWNATLAVLGGYKLQGCDT
jgi:hypothetical protein